MKLYFSNKCTEFKQNGKKLWSIIRKVIQKQNEKSSVIDCLEINNIQCYESKLIDKEFGKLFSSVGLKYANKIAASNNSLDYYLNKMSNNTKSIYFIPATESEILKVIEKLHNKNSHGHNGLSNKLIKEIKTALCKPLQILFNSSLKHGVFPEIYKNSDVVPLFKLKSKLVLTNYHPISLLPVISKILKKLSTIVHTPS